MITHLGGHSSLAIGQIPETHKHDIGEILRETIESEFRMLELVANKSVPIEEYARETIATEEGHLDEIDKMLR